jgi:hypothetical protein
MHDFFAHRFAFHRIQKILETSKKWKYREFMSSLANTVVAAGLADRIITERQLRDLLGGADGRRYGLVNRALKDGALRRLKRGTYLLDRRYRSEAAHPFAIAQSLHPGSYVSFETALAYHGWIPEAVFTTSSVSPGRKTLTFKTPDFGLFDFHPLALCRYRFLSGVRRVKTGRSTALVADPLRALMDLVALRKHSWEGLEWLTNGMRIDEDMLNGLDSKDFEAVGQTYSHKAVNEFLSQLGKAIMPFGVRTGS